MLRKLGIVFLVLIVACQNDDLTTKPPPSSDTPFDDFWFSTSFGVPATSPAYYFNTFAMVNQKQIKFGYYGYLSQGIEVPSSCSRTWLKTNNTLTVNAKCTLQREGNASPNNLEWPSSLTYEFNAVADLSTLKVTSAKLSISGYKEYDFLEVITLEKFRNALGFDQLVLSGTLKVTTVDKRELTFQIAFSERLN